MKSNIETEVADTVEVDEAVETEAIEPEVIDEPEEAPVDEDESETEETEEHLVQDTIPGCEPIYETTEERLARLESELATLTRKKIIIKGIKKHIDDEEKVIHEKILECLNEQKSPLLVKMMEAVFPREKAKVKVDVTLIDRHGEEIVAGGDDLADQAEGINSDQVEIADSPAVPEYSGEGKKYPGEWLRVSENHRVLHFVQLVGKNGELASACASAKSEEWTDPGSIVKRCKKCEAAYQQIQEIEKGNGNGE